MSLTYDEVLNYLDRTEEENRLAECIYSGALKKLKEVQKEISKLDDAAHVKRVFKPFLIQWGMMSRTLGRKKFKWTRLGRTLRKLENHFKALRDINFLDVKFEDKEISENIQKVYLELSKIKHVGPTAASKILHLANPEIFVMWDEKIRDMYNVRGTATGYLEFLSKNQRLLKDVFNKKECYELRLKFGNKTLAKLIDEFNWYIANKGITEIKKKIKRSCVKTKSSNKSSEVKNADK